MRMWNVDPTIMCRNHLLGEHVEMHMFVGSINKKKNLVGYIHGGLVEIHNIRKRHAELAKEMERRGYNHKSALPEFFSWTEGNVMSGANLIELTRRCPKCRERHKKGGDV